MDGLPHLGGDGNALEGPIWHRSNYTRSTTSDILRLFFRPTVSSSASAHPPQHSTRLTPLEDCQINRELRELTLTVALELKEPSGGHSIEFV